MALGNNAKASEDSLAIGFGATSSAPNAQAFGNGAVATSGGDISIGNLAGVGSDAKRANVDGSLIAIGVAAGQNVVGTANVAIGDKAGSNVHSNYNVSIGSEAGQGFKTEQTLDNPQNGYNVSIGYKANNFSEISGTDTTQYAIAIGANATSYSTAQPLGGPPFQTGNMQWPLEITLTPMIRAVLPLAIIPLPKTEMLPLGLVRMPKPLFLERAI